MENRLGNSNGGAIPKKSRSLDLKTLYKSSIPKDSVNTSLKRKSRPGDIDDQQKQDKKGRKVVSLSSFEKFDRDNGKGVEKACNGDITLHNLVDSKVGLDEKVCDDSGLQGISLGLGRSLIYVPRRRRGFVGRSRFENGLVHKSAGESVNPTKPVDLIHKAAVEEPSTAPDQFPKVREKGPDGEGEGSDLATQPKVENGLSSQPAVKDGQSASKQTHSKRRKRKPLAPDNRTVGEEAKLTGDTSGKLSEISREDDEEENLEANAARMLCSRFDPSCTEFSSNADASVLPSTDRLPPLSSGKNSDIHQSKLSNSKGVSDDTDDRMLRPRRNHDEKGTVRKRRHFYEILFSDVGSHWLLNKKIKVFWPLDENWYHGLVDNYDEERNMHHVKYDDRDEEWISLQGERFKILLFPAEVPGNNQRKRRRSGSKSSTKLKVNDSSGKGEKQNAKIEDSCTEDMESEPIIAWLARSSHRYKSSTLKAVKEWQKSAVLPSNVTMKLDGDVVGDTVGQNTNRSASSLSSCGLGGQIGIDSPLKYSRSAKHSKLPLVYYRRRFHSTKKGISGDINIEVLKQHHVSKSPDPEIDFSPIENSGTVDLYIPWNNSKRFGLSLSLPAVSLMSYFLMDDVIWLSHVAFLLHHGTVVTMWPRVGLEILFLNNQVGLTYLFFEGCLTEAVWLIFRVLTVFHQSDEQGTHTDMQLPASSIGFRISCIPGLDRHLAFGFCSFSEVKHSKWAYLEQNVRRHSLLVKQLPVSECTNANIKAFQKGQVLDTSVSDNSHLIEKRSRHFVNPDLVYGGSSLMKPRPSSVSDNKQSYVPPLALPCADPAIIFQSLHLKMIIEHMLPHLNPLCHTSAEYLGTSVHLASDDRSDTENFTGRRSGSSPEINLRVHAASHECESPSNHNSRTYEPVQCGSASEFASPEKGQTIGQNMALFRQQEPQESKDIANQPGTWQQQQSELENCSSFNSQVDRYETATRSNLPMNGISIHVPIPDHSEDNQDREAHSSPQSSDLASNNQSTIIPSPNPNEPTSTGQRGRSSLIGYLSHGWSDSKGNFLHTNFGNGPKRPRTQVSYSLPPGGSDSRNKGPLHKGLPHKRIRRSSDRKSADVSRGSQKDLESTSCDGNVLVTLGDRGWREYGAHVFLEPFDNNEWRLAVRISGTTRYSYRAHQFLQPGSTNRFTHAMMWKGGKDWVLEFPDRSQWSLFKEMYEECHNRNIRAASVRNIPIPGIRLIEKDDVGTEAAFTRSSSKYIRQTETDVEMALDPLRVMYDMDSDDEQCLLKLRGCSAENSGFCEITEDLFEKAMDMFEKAAYVKQRDQFELNEIEELMAGAGPVDAMKRIYDHWRTKRQRKGMPLVRHLQLPLWEKYQRELRDWELAMTKANVPYSSGSHCRVASVERPAMFAFCLKPRGLEVQHKGSKHRSHKKLSVYAHHSNAYGDHEGLNSSGRRSGGFASGDGRSLYLNHSYDYLDESPMHQVLPEMYSPRAPGTQYLSMNGNGYYRNHQNKFQRNNSRKFGAFTSTGDTHMEPLYNHRINGKRTRNERWNPYFSEWHSPNPYYSNGTQQRLSLEELQGTDVDEYKLRDAAAAAKRGRALAKLKRERAESLRYKADVAIQKAAAALMCAEAIKASSPEDHCRGL